MSDHIDGPRSIGDPVADITDLFAFTSPENPARTVVALNVFPGAGAEAIFSNALEHSIAIRRVAVAGMGDAAKFQAADQEIRFSCRFGVLERDGADSKPVQRGTCTLPDGRTLPVVVNDENGAATPDNVFRVFAGLRSDPFYLAWNVGLMRKTPNLLQHDNVLAIVIEFDTRRVLDPEKGSLFGAIGETVPHPRPGIPVGHEPPRIDWVGRPEQTNVRLNNPGVRHAVDLRDLWNQQTPFAIAEEVKPLFLQRLKESFENYDMRDDKADWTPAALAANANVFLDDFLLFDVSKPITDASHLEIEKSTINGRPYQTGGGRTADANSIDILLTWLINRDREFLQGGATGATKPGTKVFPYFASPNTALQVVAESIDLAAPPDKVWVLIGQFGGDWHPLIAKVQLTGTGVGQLRTIETVDGKQIVERLDAIDNAGRFYRYSNISGIPASNYTGTLAVKAKGGGSTVEWHAQFLANDQATFIVKLIVSTLLKVGLDSLSARFGAMK
jgi:Polyketide cyclase / dehydrase and lipid transport/Domain of unknown function (DUF4331)